jgi:hypothetical protein
MYYFYLLDADFGPGFIKICTYFPYPAKVWLNGHEWAKRQARRAGLGFKELANGFASCEDPAALQAICDRFGPGHIQGFFDRWSSIIPTPFTTQDKRAGYFYELSMRQVEVSRTLVFDDPRRARGFFEALVADNIGVGRPEEVRAVFIPTRRGVRTSLPSQTRIFSPGTDVHVDFSYKHSRVKQYLKEGRALRIETVIDKPKDIGILARLARLEHLPELIERARQINHRLLMIERAGQGCAIGSALFERIHQPFNHEGQRTGAFRFGDQRAMALAGSLCLVVHGGKVDGGGGLGSAVSRDAREVDRRPGEPPRLSSVMGAGWNEAEGAVDGVTGGGAGVEHERGVVVAPVGLQRVKYEGPEQIWQIRWWASDGVGVGARND